MEALVKDPLYFQLNDRLRGLIRMGEFKTGAQFLTERQVGERFGISRATANKALSNLVSEGVLEFRKGVGTFVRGGVLDFDLRTLMSFTEKALSGGRKPATRVLSFTQLPAEKAAPEIREALRARAGENLFFIDRLRLADGVPMILERRHVAARLCPNLSAAAARGSLYAYWTDRCKLSIAGAEQSIQAVPVGRAEARLLKVRAGAACLLVTSTGYVSGREALWFEQTLYRGDLYQFCNRLGPLQTARPAAGMFLVPKREA